MPDDATKIWAEQEPYIISLSEDDSSAAMWSMYADGGKGVAIILERESPMFRSIEDETPLYHRLRNCFYCEKSTDLIDDNFII